MSSSAIKTIDDLSLALNQEEKDQDSTLIRRLKRSLLKKLDSPYIASLLSPESVRKLQHISLFISKTGKLATAIKGAIEGDPEEAKRPPHSQELALAPEDRGVKRHAINKALEEQPPPAYFRIDDSTSGVQINQETIAAFMEEQKREQQRALLEFARNQPVGTGGSKRARESKASRRLVVPKQAGDEPSATEAQNDLRQRITNNVNTLRKLIDPSREAIDEDQFDNLNEAVEELDQAYPNFEIVQNLKGEMAILKESMEADVGMKVEGVVKKEEVEAEALVKKPKVKSSVKKESVKSIVKKERVKGEGPVKMEEEGAIVPVASQPNVPLPAPQFFAAAPLLSAAPPPTTPPPPPQPLVPSNVNVGALDFPPPPTAVPEESNKVSAPPDPAQDTPSDEDIIQGGEENEPDDMFVEGEEEKEETPAEPEEDPEKTIEGSEKGGGVGGEAQTQTGADGREELLDDAEAKTLVKDTFQWRVKDDKDLSLRNRGGVGYGTRADIPAIKPFGTTLNVTPDDKEKERVFSQKDERFEKFRGPHEIVDADAKDPSKKAGESEDITPTASKPFAKIGGQIIWIPFYGQMAKTFFTSGDYEELTSHVIHTAGGLKLKAPDPGALKNMDETIKDVRNALRSFGSMKVLLKHEGMVTKHAEWLELRQIMKSIGKYQKTTTGMYNQAGLFSGNLREAVQKAIDDAVGKMSKKKKQRMAQEPEGDATQDEPEPKVPGVAGLKEGEGEASFHAFNPFQDVGGELERVRDTFPSLF